jgi:hypothetical protein
LHLIINDFRRFVKIIFIVFAYHFIHLGDKTIFAFQKRLTARFSSSYSWVESIGKKSIERREQHTLMAEEF